MKLFNAFFFFLIWIHTWIKTGKKVSQCFFKAFQFQHAFCNCFFWILCLCSSPEGKAALSGKTRIIDNCILKLYCHSLCDWPPLVIICALTINCGCLAPFREDDSAPVPCLRGSWGRKKKKKVLAKSKGFHLRQSQPDIIYVNAAGGLNTEKQYFLSN